MRATLTRVLVAVVSFVVGGHAWAQPVLTFEGLQKYEPISDYYDGGNGGLGTGPGPNYGITFSAYALAYIPTTPYINDPSPPTVLIDWNMGTGAGQPTAFTMDVTGGFAQQLSFYDIVVGRAATVTIYSGLDASGSTLATLTIPTQSLPGVFVPETIDFSGIAESVVFNAGSQQLVLDNITFGAVPEPSAWICLTFGMASSWLVFARRRGMSIFRA